MDNAFKIDEIIEDLTSKIGNRDLNTIGVESLSDEQQAIKTFLEEHRIRYLIHFTDAKNIPSIKEKGILSVKQLNKDEILFISNDKDRYDNQLDYISLSVSGMNQFLYKTFRYSKQAIEHGVAVVIDSSILYKEVSTPRIYCNTNAATSDSKKGSSLVDFEAMFADIVEYWVQSALEQRVIDRSSEKRASYEPTDIQAEILWNKCVPTEYIVCYWDLEEDFFYGN